VHVTEGVRRFSFHAWEALSAPARSYLHGHGDPLAVAFFFLGIAALTVRTYRAQWKGLPPLRPWGARVAAALHSRHG
jgi:hypothetical protein